MYFVYTDSLHNCIHKRTPENSQIVCRPSLDHEELGYKYGPVDIQVKVVVHETLEKYVTRLHHSLRYGDSDDRNKEIAACDSLGHAPEKLEILRSQSGVDQPPVTCDRHAVLPGRTGHSDSRSAGAWSDGRQYSPALHRR